MMTTTDDTAALRAGLVDHLADVLTSPMWRTAFRVVPRHAFAPRFAIHDPATNTFTHYDAMGSDVERRTAALAAAYSDDTLITRFDVGGTPVSSSTEPTLMATMLEALAVQPGDRVLEIGTGTGYNAALLCEALGDTNVTTIDLDSDLVSAARIALDAVGYEPAVVCGDGSAGVPDRAPFDRIIATCGVARVPAAWTTQLSPSGAILVNISKGIVLLRRHRRDLAGRFLSPAGFMPLRSTGDHARWSGRQIVDATSGSADTMHAVVVPSGMEFTTAAFFADLIADRSQLIFVHDEDDTVSSYRWVHPRSLSWARIDLADGRAIVGETGPRRLWTELTPVIDSWQAAGRPGIDRYGLTVTQDGQHILWLDRPEHRISGLA